MDIKVIEVLTMENADFLKEETLRYWLKRIQARDDMIAVLCAAARRIAADEGLRSLFLAEQQKHGPQNLWQQSWDDLPMDEAVTAVMEEPSQFYYLSYLAALPWTLERYRQMGIPEVVFDDTIRQLPFLFLEKHDDTGRWEYAGFGWIWRHLAAQLYRLGRMQFMAIPYARGERVFRNRGDGTLAVLCNPAMALRADGWADGAGGRHEEHPWHGVCERTTEGWRGNPVSREGRVLGELIELPDTLWEPALFPGDTVLDMHIPKDGDFTPDTCRESVAMAEAFFARHFPEITFKGLFCHTWMFTAQLDQFLKPGSHILAFRDEFHRLPVAGSVNYLWKFVFGEAYTRENAPRDTSLRRAVLEHLDASGEVFDLAGVALQGSKGWKSSISAVVL